MQTSKDEYPDMPPAWAIWEFVPPVIIVLIAVLTTVLVIIVWYLIKDIKQDKTSQEELTPLQENRERAAKTTARRLEAKARAIKDESFLYKEICRRVATFQDGRRAAGDSQIEWHRGSATITESTWRYTGAYFSGSMRYTWTIESKRVSGSTEFVPKHCPKPPRENQVLRQYQSGTTQMRRDFAIIRNGKVVDEGWRMVDVPDYTQTAITHIYTATIQHAYAAIIALIDHEEGRSM